MSINIQELKSKINISRLSRNYFDKPLKLSTSKRNQYHPTKEDIEYLYIELNLTRKICADIFNIGQTSLKRFMKEYGIKKPRILVHNNVKKGVFDKYGVEFYSQTQEYIEKVKNTSRKRFGNDYYTQTDEYRKRVIKTRNDTRKSKKEKFWLDMLNIPLKNRNVYLEYLFINVDGYDKENKTVYEFLGDYWHGNPRLYSDNDRFNKTVNRFKTLSMNGYKIIYCWEYDFDNNENLIREYNGEIEY